MFVFTPHLGIKLSTITDEKARTCRVKDRWRDGWMDGWIDGWMDGLMDDGWMDEWMDWMDWIDGLDGWVEGWMEGWIVDGWTDGRMDDGWMDGWMEGWLAEWMDRWIGWKDEWTGWMDWRQVTTEKYRVDTLIEGPRKRFRKWLRNDRSEGTMEGGRKEGSVVFNEALNTCLFTLIWCRHFLPNSFRLIKSKLISSNIYNIPPRFWYIR